jgi:predicted ATPase
MGKSTVIQALLLLRQSERAGMLRPPGPTGGQSGLLLNGELTRLGTGADVLYEGAGEDTVAITVDAGPDLTPSWSFSTPENADLLPWLDGPASPPALPIFGSHCCYLGAERIGPRNVYALSASQIERQDLGADGALAAAFLDAHGGDNVLPPLQHAESPSAGLLSQANAWMGEISPGVRLDTRVLREVSLARLSFSFVTGKDTSRLHRPTSVGFGLSYTLPVVVALLAAREGSLVLIENPEAHLHPRGQMAMGDLIARAAAAGAQVIVETHSDHVLNGVRLAVHGGTIDHERVVFHFFQRDVLHDEESGDRAVHRVVSPKIDKNGRIDQRPDGFFDQWDKSLRRLLMPRKR